MQPLRYGINVTLDGCVHHEAGLPPDEESMALWTAELERSDSVLYGRTTYQMMESAWRRPAVGGWPDWMGPGEVSFAEVLDRMPKHVVSSSLDPVDWNAELLRGDLAEAVARLRDRPGDGISLGGVTLPTALASLGLVDEFLLVVHPVVAGHGPTLLGGLRDRLRLDLVERRELASGLVAMRYVPAAT